MFELNIRSAATAILTALVLSTVTAATQAADTTRDFGTQTCKEIMRQSGSDRDISLAFAHGYVLGKKGTTRYEVDALAKITDQFIDYCLDHPAENALQSFEKFAM